jgi:hypothetical protein
MNNTTNELFAGEIKVINIGLELFTDTLTQQQVKVTHVQWEPPAQGDPELMSLLDDLL